MKMNVKTINAHCVVVYTDDGNNCTWSATVFSYDTPVLHHDGVNDTLHRLWGGWSVISIRDINKAFTWAKMDKKTWDAMPVETI